MKLIKLITNIKLRCRSCDILLEASPDKYFNETDIRNGIEAEIKKHTLQTGHIVYVETTTEYQIDYLRGKHEKK